MIEKIYERAQGMATVSRRAFSHVREPDLGAAWSDAVSDPFALLERRLARIVGGVPRTTERDPGEVQASDWPRHHASEGPGFARKAPRSTLPLDRRHRTELARSGFAFSEEARPSPEAEARVAMERRAGKLPEPAASDWQYFQDKPVTTLQEGSKAANELRVSAPAFRRPRATAPPRFSYGDEREISSKDIHAEAAIPSAGTPASLLENARTLARRDIRSVSNGPDHPPNHTTASGATNSLLSNGEKSNSRLVGTSGLIHLLKKNTPPVANVPVHSSASVVAADSEYPTSIRPSEGSTTKAVTVEEVLEELEDRLHFDFLRMYGSSGE